MRESLVHGPWSFDGKSVPMRQGGGSSPRLRASVVSLLLILLVGCTESKPAATEHEHEHGLTHEEEHGILPHKPRTFAAAIEQIDKRGHELLAHRHDHDVAEWFDILGWLPELAGDTELKKPEWDQVARIARELEQWSAPWRSSEKSSIDVAVLERHVSTLKGLVPQPMLPQ